MPEQDIAESWLAGSLHEKREESVKHYLREKALSQTVHG
jgi:hypothetical protein